MVQGFADWLFGLKESELEHLSDDRIGRALDRLFDADRAALLTDVVVAVRQRFGVRFEEFHSDSASIRFWSIPHGLTAHYPRTNGAGDHLRLFQRPSPRADSLTDLPSL
jgi:hypothetical protein